jgi:hypothetical protein
MVPDQQSKIPSSAIAKQENIELESFNGITVRKVMQNGKGMIPVVDISNAVKLDRSNISKHLDTFKLYYEPYKGEVRITTPGGIQTLVCLTRDGILGLLFKINASKSKDPKMIERILEFQHWATSILAQNKVGDLTLHQGQPLTKQATLDCINYHLDIAEIAIKRSKVPEDVAHKQAWALAATETNIEMVNAMAGLVKVQSKQDQLQLTEAIPEDQAAFQSHFSRRKIAEFLKLTEDKTRDLLEGKNIICFRNGMWELTGFGQRFGKVFYVTPQAPYVMAKRAQIKYNPDLLKYLKGEGFEIPETRVKEDGPL